MRFVLTFLIFLISGCSSTIDANKAATDVVIEQIESAKDSFSNLESSLSKECKTDVVLAEIDAHKRNLNSLVVSAESAKNACTAEKKALASTLDTWKTRTYGLFVALVVAIGIIFKKLFRKLV